MITQAFMPMLKSGRKTADISTTFAPKFILALKMLSNRLCKQQKSGRIPQNVICILGDESIINEFKNNNDIIARQIRYIKNFDEIGGFYLFSYSCLFDENCKNEVENLLKEMRE